jgi:hypothetical protein
MESLTHIGPLIFLIFNLKKKFRTQETLDHLTSLLSSREMIPQPGIEPPTTPFGLEYISTIIR